MSKKETKDYESDYTHPSLREKLKEEIKMSDKGGRHGQWSARKSQILTKQYEIKGGGYKHPGELSGSQESLKQWTNENWRTMDNQKAIGDNTIDRYLPEDVWDNLTEQEKSEARQSKLAYSKNKKQYAPNTPAVKKELQKMHKRNKQD